LQKHWEKKEKVETDCAGEGLKRKKKKAPSFAVEPKEAKKSVCDQATLRAKFQKHQRKTGLAQ